MRSSRPSLRRSPALLGALVMVALGALMLGGCAAAPAGTAATPVISGAWVRPATGPGLPAAGYLVIRNPGGVAETLTGVSTPGAGSVEMHKTSTMSGMTGMEPVSAIHIPAGGTVTLEPGGFHLMLMSPATMRVGGTVDLVLTFEKAGSVTVKAEVKNG